MNNFSLTFGQKPENLIERRQQLNQIITDFSLDIPLSMSYVITGVRGSGKTVLLSLVGKQFSSNKDWVVIDINPEREILEQIAAKLYETPSLKKLFISKSFSFSFHGVGFSISGKEPISNIRSLLDKMLDKAKKEGKKILITIDEVSNAQTIKAFLHDYQSFLREGFPVYLLMTGLTENVDSLQNSKTLTFLYRSPKIVLSPLNVLLVKKSYSNIFNISEEEALELAQLTKGYPFAYQVVGFLYSKYKDVSKIINELDKYLFLYVYDKIYSSLPAKQVMFLRKIKVNEDTSIAEIMKDKSFSAKEVSVYRSRLFKRGLIDISKRGYVSFLLPRFGEYLLKQL